MIPLKPYLRMIKFRLKRVVVHQTVIALSVYVLIVWRIICHFFPQFRVIDSIESGHIENIYFRLTRSAADCDCRLPKSFVELPNILIDRPVEGDKNIFFVETWRHCNRMAHLTPRAACAIESAARVNPDWKVYVFFIDVIGYWDRDGEDALIRQLQLLPNVFFVGISLEELSKNTPLHEWILAKHYLESKYLVSHVSDFTRLMVLYKYPGTYMDTDIISLQPLDRLGRNFITAESTLVVAPGFMNLGADNVGRSVVQELVERFKMSWNPEIWAAQGPGLVTNFMRERCNTTYSSKMNRERCGGMDVVSKDEVLSIDFYSRHFFFDVWYLENGLKLIKESVGTHLWNAFSGSRKLAKSEPVLLNHLGENQCPSIFYWSGSDEW